jgi:hypothetical protein
MKIYVDPNKLKKKLKLSLSSKAAIPKSHSNIDKYSLIKVS